MHYNRWYASGDPGEAELRKVHDYRGRPCSVQDCDKPARCNGYCHRHSEQARRTGSPIPNRPRGVITTYAGIHQLLRRLRGPASEYECVDCGSPARSWSYSHECPDEGRGRHGPKVLPFCIHIDCYSPRCEACHTRYDAGR